MCMGLRMQQAWGVGAAIARAAGAMEPTSSRTNSDLAVRRCIDFRWPENEIGEREERSFPTTELKQYSPKTCHKIVKSAISFKPHRPLSRLSGEFSLC